MGNSTSSVEGEGKHAELLNPEAMPCPVLDPGTLKAGSANLKVFARLAAGFAVILNYVFRITEASEDRIYESGDRKISE